MVKAQKITRITYFSFLICSFLFAFISLLIQCISNIANAEGLGKTYETLILIFVSVTNLSGAVIACYGLVKLIITNKVDNKLINISSLSLLARDVLYLITYLFSFYFTFYRLGYNTLDTKGILLVMLLIYDVVFIFVSLFINYNLNRKSKGFMVTISMVFSILTSVVFILGHAIYLTPIEIIRQIVTILMFVFTVVNVYLEDLFLKHQKKKD
ncbi:MAG: hypothetical protein ACI31G_05010 [Bacilli bacterium]